MYILKLKLVSCIKKLSIFFAILVTIAYICGFFVYKIRRTLESKALNEDLKAFKERGNVNE